MRYFPALDRGDHTDSTPIADRQGEGMSHLSPSFSAAVRVRIEVAEAALVAGVARIGTHAPR
jgi:hypothetical protein